MPFRKSTHISTPEIHSVLTALPLSTATTTWNQDFTNFAKFAILQVGLFTWVNVLLTAAREIIQNSNNIHVQEQMCVIKWQLQRHHYYDNNPPNKVGTLNAIELKQDIRIFPFTLLTVDYEKH